MEYREEILQALKDPSRFIRLTLSGPQKPSEAEWLKVVVRPVTLAGERRLQFAFQGPRKQIVRNVERRKIAEELDGALALGFRHINLQCADGDLHARITSKGKVLISRGKPSKGELPATAHNREKEYPFPEGEENPFLEALGIMRHGRVLPRMRDKFRQINHFLMLLDHTRLLKDPPSGEVRILDCGCGLAYLTFSACEYLRGKRGLDVTVTGIDANEEIISRARELKARTGLEDVELVQARISEYVPSETPHAVLSLHACDTATDEAIAKGVEWGSRLILSSPCCQHELHHSLKRPELAAALRHGILRERTADIVTDAFRAAALRVMGYATDVIEFIDPTHTSKNLMIRAEKGREKSLPGAVEEYRALKEYWGVAPAIERLLGEDFRKRVEL
jgi:SAM-dependent methyltransferase